MNFSIDLFWRRYFNIEKGTTNLSFLRTYTEYHPSPSHFYNYLILCVDIRTVIHKLNAGIGMAILSAPYERRFLIL
jgi:hypothetical protein